MSSEILGLLNANKVDLVLAEIKSFKRRGTNAYFLKSKLRAVNDFVHALNTGIRKRNYKMVIIWSYGRFKRGTEISIKV